MRLQELLAKAQFEEARIRELAPARKQVHEECSGARKSVETSKQKPQSGGVQRVVQTDNTCFTCGGKKTLCSPMPSQRTHCSARVQGRPDGYSGTGSRKT